MSICLGITMLYWNHGDLPDILSAQIDPSTSWWTSLKSSGSLVTESDYGETLEETRDCQKVSTIENQHQPVSKWHCFYALVGLRWHYDNQIPLVTQLRLVLCQENTLKPSWKPAASQRLRRWPRWPSTSPRSTSAAGSAPPPPPPPTSRDPMWRTTPTTPCPTRPGGDAGLVTWLGEGWGRDGGWSSFLDGGVLFLIFPPFSGWLGI